MDTNKKKEAILQKKEYDVSDLVTVVEILRAPGGCPWDREQTHKSIRADFIEETYEVIEAIDKEDAALLREELGDVLLQVVMHAQMEAEAGRCTFSDIAGDICRKMIHRHPHVFGTAEAETSAEVLANWEVIKSAEKKRETVTDKLQAIPRQFPALMRAVKVGKKASVLDFPDAESVAKKVEEELAEVRGAVATGDKKRIEEEMGDLLLTVASLARKLGVNAEEALTAATDKFISRFAFVEGALLESGRDFSVTNEQEMNILWEKSKKIDQNGQKL